MNQASIPKTLIFCSFSLLLTPMITQSAQQPAAPTPAESAAIKITKNRHQSPAALGTENGGILSDPAVKNDAFDEIHYPAPEHKPLPGRLGTTYEIPNELMENPNTSWLTGFIASEIPVLQLIKDSVYHTAYDTNTKIAGINSEGLDALITALILQQEKQRTAKITAAIAQREELTKHANRILVLLKELNTPTHKHPKKIDYARLTKDFERIQELRRTNLSQQLLELEETRTMDNVFKTILAELSAAHENGSKTMPIPPELNLELFVNKCVLPSTTTK